MPTRRRVTGAGTGTFFASDPTADNPLNHSTRDNQLEGSQVDERGIPFFQNTPNVRTYLPPVAYGAPTPADDSGWIHSRHWDPATGTFKRTFDWNTLISLGALGGIAAPIVGGAVAGSSPSMFMGPVAESGVSASVAAPTAAAVAPGTFGPLATGMVPATSAAVPAALAAPAGGLMGGAASNPYLWMALANIGSSAISGALAPDGSGGDRQSFDGTGADPVSWMTDLRKMLGDTYTSAVSRANEPISVGGMPFDMTQSPDGSFSSPPPMSPTFDNPALPFGPMSGPQSRPGAFTMPGFGMPNIPGSTAPGQNTQNAPHTNNPTNAPTTGSAQPRRLPVNTPSMGNPSAQSSAPITASSRVPITGFGAEAGADTATALPLDSSSPNPQIQSQAAARLLLHALQGTS